jgi:hypothetical protein
VSNTQLRADLSAAVASRQLPPDAHKRALHFIDFIDKIGATLPTALQTPVPLDVNTVAQLLPQPSLHPAGTQTAPAVQPFPSK